MMRIVLVTVVAIAIPALSACQLRPKAFPDAAVAVRGTPINIPVLDNDTDPRDRELTIVQATGSAKGAAAVNADQTVRYTPNMDAVGRDVFSYSIKNTRGRTSTAEVTVTILDSASPPKPLAATPLPKEPRPAEAAATKAVPPVVGDAVVRSPAPAAPLPVASASATLTGISVTLFTREDDKDAGEAVQLTVRRGEATLAQRMLDASEAWGKQTDRTEEIEFKPPVSGAEASTLTLEVRKIPGLGAGEGWIMQIDVQGRLSDGRTVPLVPKSLPFRFGAGSSNNRSWKFSSLPPVR